MKILILSDLHITVETICSQFKLEKYKRILNNQITSDYDVVLISGDVFEHQVPQYVNVFETLQYLFDNHPVIFCLGNHEFAYEDHDSVLKTYKAQKEVYMEHSNTTLITCLDIDGYSDFDNFRIVGNVFWYDWSLNNCRTLMKGEIIDGWLDSTIKNFDPLKEHKKCKEQIFDNLKKDKNTILLTHTVPHEILNSFNRDEPNSPFNSYSGVKDFLKEVSDLNVKYAFCGHTHRPENHFVYGIHCLNIGNDYFFRTNKIKWAVFEVNEDLDLMNIDLSK